MTATTPASPSASVRLHGLDALRAGALGLGIVIHSLMPFLPGANVWLFSDSARADAAGVVVSWIHLFRMVLFMLLAGYFGRLMLRRRGSGGYLRDRTKRILLPLLVFMPLALASLIGVGVLNTSVRGVVAEPPPLPPGIPQWLLLLNPAHLWFLGILMECIVITVLAHAVLRRVLGAERLTGMGRRLGALFVAPAGVLLAAVPYFVAVVLQGRPGSGIDQPITIVPTVSAVLGYLGAFVVGWCLHAHTDALRGLARTWPLQIGVAVVLTVVGYFVQVGSIPLVAHAALIALSGWTWTFGLVGLTVRFLHRENRAVRYLADSSYWVYIAHLPVVAVVQIFLADLGWPIIVKLLVTWVVSGIVLLLSYDLLVRRSWLGRWLNGRRYPSLLLSTRPGDLPPAPSDEPPVGARNPG